MFEFSSSAYSVKAITRRRPLSNPIPPIIEESSGASNKESTTNTTPTTTSNKNNNNNTTNNDDNNNERLVLHRKLGLLDIIFYGVGCSVGAGIYSLVGIGAKLAGPAIALSFLICGIACCFTSLSYAEFSARVPLAGSAYTFTYVSFGELAGWLVGWNLTLGYAISAAVVARSWAEYSVGFIQGYITTTTTTTNTESISTIETYLTKFPIPFIGKEYTCCPLSMVIILICTIILIMGVKESTRFNTIMTLLNLSILLFVLLSGIQYVNVTNNLIPFFPHGITGMAHGAGLVFFSYLGFDMVACLSEECTNPERNMPIGIIGSLLVSMFIYISVTIVVVGMAPIHILGDDTPITNALLSNACCTATEQQKQQDNIDCLSYSTCSNNDNILHPILYIGSKFISFGAIFGLTTATFACLMGQPRISYAASVDGLLFPIFKQININTGVPTTGTIITGIITAFIACFINLEALANTISLGTLQVFTFVNASVIVLRMRGATTYSTSDDDDDDIDDNGSNVEMNDKYNDNESSKEEDDEGNQQRQSDRLPDESTSLLTSTTHQKQQQQDTSLSNTTIIDPGIASIIRSLGLIQESSRDIRKKVQHSERAHDVTRHESTIPVYLVSIYTFASITLSIYITNEGSSKIQSNVFIIYVLGLIIIISAILLFIQPKSSPPETFACPMVPAIPLLGITFNSYMMGSMPISTWYIIIGWLFIGLVFYLSYGIHHSALRHHH